MAYNRNPTWKNWPDKSTPVTATELENIENGIVDAATQADSAVASLAGKAGASDLNGLSAKVDARTRLVAPTGTAAENVTTLQNAVNDAATAGAPIVVRGSFSLAGQITVPAGSDIQFSQTALVTQTSSLTPVFVINNANGVRLSNIRVQGKTSDYVNNSNVYGASAIRVSGTSSDVLIEGGSLLGVAGSGVYIAGTTSGVTVRNVRMTGAGSSYILSTSYNYSGGVVADPGASRWSVIGCDISGFSQGVVTGDNLTDVRILDNYIHDIPGQHGFYIETVNGAIISGNLVRNTGLLGMKIQIGSVGATDADTVTISDNIFLNAGAQGILLADPIAGTPKFRRISITGNVINGASGHGIEIASAIGVHIADNVIYNTSAGMRLTGSSALSVLDNRINKTAQDGIVITDSSDWTIAGNRIIDPASANGASTEFGIHIAGTSSDGTLRSNKITDSLGNMRYGIYMDTGDQASIDFIDNYSTGATDYGTRLISGVSARTWRNNAVAGTLGSVLNPVPSATVDPYGGPGTHGMTGANFDPALAVANAAAMTAGVLYLHKVVVPSGGAITKVWLTLGSGGTGLTAGQCLVGVYDTAGNLLGQSPDLSTTLNSAGNKVITLNSPTAAISGGGSVYVAVLWNGTTSPVLRGISGSAAGANINLAASASRWATAGTAQTSLPSTLPAMTASLVEQWVGVS